jgi:hypothetical protein
MRIKAKTVASAETSPPPLFLGQLQEQPESDFPDFQERCPFINGLFSLALEAWTRSCFALAALMSPKQQKKKVPQKAAPSGGLDGDGRMADGYSGGEQALIEFICRILVHVGKHTGTGVEGDAHSGVVRIMPVCLCADPCSDPCCPFTNRFDGSYRCSTRSLISWVLP